MMIVLLRRSPRVIEIVLYRIEIGRMEGERGKGIKRVKRIKDRRMGGRVFDSGRRGRDTGIEGRVDSMRVDSMRRIRARKSKSGDRVLGMSGGGRQHAEDARARSLKAIALRNVGIRRKRVRLRLRLRVRLL